ncbi:hypothetical protein [Sphingorhabdus sp.]|uniref:hypothetical protein n=1 Tax=Sphingorhabdus sp. TaxID=1902408 RepID=UPI0035936B5E
METLTKIDVARRQLVTAIRLLLDDRDPVSVYSLATNAQEILSALCERRGVLSLRANIAAPTGVNSGQIQIQLINPARNFFKHADRDPDSVWSDFTDSDCDHILLIPSIDFVMLERKSPIEAQVFVIWYAALYPEKIPQNTDWSKAAAKHFSGIRAAQRSDQKRAASALIAASLKDPGLIAHPETYPSEIRRWA